MISSTVDLLEEYETKLKPLSNYHKLCIADTIRLFEKSINYMNNNSLNVNDILIEVRVGYWIKNLKMNYNKKNNQIVMMDII